MKSSNSAGPNTLKANAIKYLLPKFNLILMKLFYIML